MEPSKDETVKATEQALAELEELFSKGNRNNNDDRKNQAQKLTARLGDGAADAIRDIMPSRL